MKTANVNPKFDGHGWITDLILAVIDWSESEKGSQFFRRLLWTIVIVWIVYIILKTGYDCSHNYRPSIYYVIGSLLLIEL